ncbi:MULTISPECIES: FAD:protein FMN transferase [Arthrobacter]|uniref:FAD:protein FMN transferase n=2 Tax=Arthrobacter TaxID=1663 RepID=A0ABU9KNT9_9MICC|nr:FAD:protein FMN transferase [Arthrobacter sp. YJM1]MDP5228409.1 FAD:protein FMN transferase [Arthrobacter sp. YJM1]
MPPAAPLEFDALGTSWWIRAEGLESVLEGRVRDRLNDFDATWSRFRGDSLAMRLAAPADVGRADGERTVEFPAEAAPLGRLYRELHDLSGGSVTPFIGASLAQLGYDPDYSLQPHGEPVPAPRWGEDVDWDGRTVSARTPVVLDIGAAGKGLAVDLVCEILLGAGLTDFLVDAGGDMRRHGGTSDRIALENPFDTRQAIGVVELHDGALAASAVNRRAWGEGLHHVLDGLTGRPVRRVVASWVLAPDAMTADGLATALFFVPGVNLAERHDVHWLSVHSDGHAEGSPYFLEGLHR